MIIDTAGMFILNNKRELLIAHPTKHPIDFWSIPKGKMDADDCSPLAAAFRETWEEVNFDFRLFGNINLIKLPPIVFKNKRKRLYPFLVMAEANPEIDFDAVELKCNSDVPIETYGHVVPEMDDFKWVTLEEAKTLVHASQVECIEIIEMQLMMLT